METLWNDDQDQDKDADDDDAKLHSNGRKRANFPIQWASHPDDDYGGSDGELRRDSTIRVKLKKSCVSVDGGNEKRMQCCTTLTR